MFEHLLLQRLDAFAEILLRHRLDFGGSLRGLQFVLGGLVRDHAVDHVADALVHRARRDAQRQVVRDLLGTAAFGLADGRRHRVGHLVGVQDGAAVDVARRAADGLDQRPLGAQEAFLVGVEDGHQADLGQVQSLAQQVDADQHVEGAQPQVAQDLHALHGVDVAVQVTHLDAVVGQVFGELLGHALGQRRDQHAFVVVDAVADLLQHVVDLARRGAHFHFGVDQPGRPHQLLDDLPGVRLLPCRRRRRDEHRLPHLAFEFLELERPVVQRAGQPEAVLHQRRLACAVAVVHAAELADQDMALVQEHQRVGRQVVHQRRRRLAGRGPREVAGVVLDALAVAHLLQHLEVEARALFQPLRLDQLASLDELVQALAQFVLDGGDGVDDAFARRHVMAAGVDGEARDLLPHAAGERVQQLQALDLVVEELDAQRELAVLCGEDVDGVAAHAERAAPELDLVALVLHADQLLDDVALAHPVARAQRHHHLVIVGRVADAVDGADAGHDDDVAPLEQALGGAQPHLLDVLVDGAVLLDEQVALRHVGLGLVVVVVADEVLDRVAREELAELAVQLRRQRLVGGEDDGRAAEAGDDVGHREGLAGAGDAEQGLVGQAVGDALGELRDRRRLVAGRCEGLEQLEGRAGEGHELAHGRRAGVERRGLCHRGGVEVGHAGNP